MAVKDCIFIGATLIGAPDCDRYFGPVKIPGSMSKADTIKRHVDEVMAERLEQKTMAARAYAGSTLPSDQQYECHVHRPSLCVLTSVTVIGRDRSILYQQAVNGKGPERGRIALPLIRFLKEQFPRQFASSLRFGDAEPETLIFGFNIKQVLRIAGFEVLKRNLSAGEFEQCNVPVRLWHNPLGVFDPLDVLLPAADQRDLDLYSLLRYFEIEADAAGLTVSAQKQAETAADLVEKAQLASIVS